MSAKAKSSEKTGTPVDSEEDKPAAKPRKARTKKIAATGDETTPKETKEPKEPARKKKAAKSSKKSAGSSGGKLIIVESPAKAKTIERYLDGAYEVIPTMGHVRDLPKDRFGIDVKKDFKPFWRVIPARDKLLKELRDRAALMDEVLIATDPDREGEAIGFHVAEEIKAKNVKRVEFHEITANAVRESLSRPREINRNKVDSQFARRILDRIVGYRLSPLLWKSVRSGLSAGRVQSVAVRLVCDREHKIKTFVPETYYRILLTLSPAGRADDKFVAEVFKVEGKRRRVKTREEADRIVEAVRKGPLAIQEYLETEREQHAAPPLVTSTFQQAAVNRLGMTARHAMVVAQQLYEGINIGKYGRRGLITYHRTDSVRLSAAAVEAARVIIRERYGEAYLPVKPVFYKNRRAAQDAHEAIRPADTELTPEKISDYLTNEQRQVYTLVWELFIASQMKAAVYHVRTVYVSVGGSADLEFVARGEDLKFDGYLRLRPDAKREKGGYVPALKKGEMVDLQGHEVEEKQTQPLPRFSEATLVRELEHRGIGRPSTYATILTTVVERGYVQKQAKELFPTELGEITNKLLIEHFPLVLDIDFTASLEEKLDSVEDGDAKWVELISDFYTQFAKLYEKAQEALKDKKKELTKPPIEVLCQACGRPMVMRWSKYGKFLACSGYPECHSVRDIDETGGQFRVVDIQVSPTPCPVCGSEVHSRRGPYGRFWACKTFPKCKYTRPVTLGITCPKGCGGEVVRRRTRRGRFFFGCSRYPECDFTTWLEPVLTKCPQCQSPYLVKSERKNRTLVKCPVKECGYIVPDPTADAAPAAVAEVASDVAPSVEPPVEPDADTPAAGGEPEQI